MCLAKITKDTSRIPEILRNTETQDDHIGQKNGKHPISSTTCPVRISSKPGRIFPCRKKESKKMSTASITNGEYCRPHRH
jgi:hypothetical protein